MRYAEAPTSVRSLEQRIRNLEGDEQLMLRRRIGMALVVVGQLLPEGAIKGGSAMALRYGRGTRFTQDLDAARSQPLGRFRRDFEDALVTGWAGFTGRLIEKAPSRPTGVPTAPSIEVGDGWATLYASAVEDVDALPDVVAAVAWVNELVPRIAAGDERRGVRNAPGDQA